MNSIFLFLIFVVSIIVIVSVIIFLKIKLTQGEDEEENGAICINLMSKYTNDYSIGIEKEVIIGRGKRFVIDFIPLDIRPKDIGNVQIQKIIVGRNKRILLGVSKEKEIVMYLPPNSSDIEGNLKREFFGQAIMEAIEKINGSVQEKELLEERIKVLSKIAEKTFGIGMIKDYLETDSELMKDRFKKLFSDKEFKGSTDFSSLRRD